MPPGPATPPPAVDRNQRERLFAALIAVTEEKGYEETRVEDLVKLSGVSRRDFYKRFDDKQDCLLGAVREIFQMTMMLLPPAETAGGNGDPPRVGADPASVPDARAEAELRAREALGAFLTLLSQQPGAARLCFCEVYAGGPEALAAVDEVLRTFADRIRERMRAVPGYEQLPERVPNAIMGGYHKLIQTRLYRREEGELPGLAEEMTRWALAYEPPPTPLRQERHGPAPASPVIPREGEPGERLLRALAALVAERGYPKATVAGIVRRASTSQRTFYEHFSGREEAMLAAFDRGSSALLEAMLPASRGAKSWPEAVRLGLEALLAFAAREPEFALLGLVGGYALGRPAFEQRDRVLSELEALMEPGFELNPDVPRIAPEAIGGALLGLIYEQLTHDGSETLPAVGPLGTYICLAPFIGPERAAEEANAGRP